LANGRGATGAIVIFNYAGQVFTTMAAVLAGAIAISAFPVLCARDGSVFDRTSAGSTRAVLLASWLGAAVMAAITVPFAHVLAKQPDQVPQLIQGFALMAPGLVGIGVITNLSRVMFATGRLKVAAGALGGSWLLVIVADVVLAELVPARLVVAALALGATIGQTLVAIPLGIITRRICGKETVRGVGRTTLAGLAAAAAGAAVGVAVGVALPIHHKLMAAGIAVLAAGCAVVVFGVVAYILDDGDLRTALARMRQAVKLRRATRQHAT
jgi:putative peptidoglycan lipid II flippase